MSKIKMMWKIQQPSKWVVALTIMTGESPRINLLKTKQLLQSLHETWKLSLSIRNTSSILIESQIAWQALRYPWAPKALFHLICQVCSQRRVRLLLTKTIWFCLRGQSWIVEHNSHNYQASLPWKLDKQQRWTKSSSSGYNRDHSSSRKLSKQQLNTDNKWLKHWLISKLSKVVQLKAGWSQI